MPLSMKRIEVSFDLSVFSIDAVKHACYRFVDRFTADIQTREGQAVCELTFADGATSASVDEQVMSLRKEVLDHDLRFKIKAETEAVRNLILAHAFSKTGLIADE